MQEVLELIRAYYSLGVMHREGQGVSPVIVLKP